MATLPLIAPATGAVANTTNAFDSSGYTGITVSAPGLATTEEVDIYTKTPGGYAIFGVTGTAWKLTATIQSIALPAGPVYAFAKDVTAGSVGVYIDAATL